MSAGVMVPAARASSNSMTLSTPSIIFCTSCTSEKPRRCLLDTSNLPPSAAECSPAEPRGCRSKQSQTCSSRCLSSSTLEEYSSLNLSSVTMTEALSPVPRLEGQVPMKPSVSFHISLVPLLSADFLISSDSRQNRSKTDLMLPPSSMEMMRQWSSSLTQASTVLLSLWKMPRWFGQLRAAPAPVSRFLAEGIWKRKPSLSSDLVVSSFSSPSL
mmetsp:Transcript_25043/g.34390  ORF Transcript_25043/g.34390 Transcript_25043/m.34390 type:complete len:214 (-) Transcript_25043:750-1391(-)